MVGLIEFHMKARGHPTATAKGKERGDALIHRATRTIIPCGVLLPINLYETKSYTNI